MNTVLARRVGVVALLAATTTALTACAGVVGAKMTFDDTEQTKITDIVIAGNGSADVTVTTKDVQATSIRRIVQSSGNPGPSYTISGSTMTLSSRCGINCSLEYEITAPLGVNVRGGVGSGDITLTGAGTTDVSAASGDVTIADPAGTVQAHSGSGDVKVSNPKAAVTADAGSGDVTVLGAAGGVTARTGSGDVDVKVSVPESVNLRAGSGDVQLTVPAGKYQVDAHTGSGDKSIAGGVQPDSSSKDILTVQAGSGDLDIYAN